ncbi:MAG: hypothetical protein AB7I38_19130 [Dehalococcoidia bacterium]|uniref:hypothetical protein n=1 Tax=Mycolicibacterium sp. TaxID=2320850 RepID=UPI003D11E787
MNRAHDGRDVDAREVVAAHWPYDGPYSGEQTAEAGVLVERLVRYLNNATTKPTALPYAAVAGSVIGSLHAAVAGMEQLTRQLARFAAAQAHDPSVYDDRGDRPGAATALELAAALTDAAPAVAELADRLAQAGRLSYHLGNDR